MTVPAWQQQRPSMLQQQSPPPKQQQQQQQKNIKWPPTMTEWTVRVFTKCKTPEEKELMAPKMKAIIQTKIKNETLWTTDWSRVPIPELATKTMQRMRPSRWDLKEQEENHNDETGVYLRERSISPLPTYEEEILRKPKSKKKKSKKKKGKKKRNREYFDDTTSPAEQYKRANRLKRFKKSEQQISASKTKNFNTKYLRKQKAKAVEGTCIRLEKSFFRLTSAPHPSDVRPEYILKKSLEMVMRKIENGCDYLYVAFRFVYTNT